MKDVLSRADDWIASEEAIAVATVVAVRRSAPRPPGAKMLVSADGGVEGMVSGGCVEGAVAFAAQEVLRDGRPRLQHYGIADDEAFAVGLPCGGEIDVWIERLDHASLLEISRSDGRGARVVRFDTGAAMTVRADGRREGSLGSRTIDQAAAADADELMWAGRSAVRTHEGVDCFVDCVFPSPRLIVFGAVDYSRALCTLARAVGWIPYVIDPRGFFATGARFPDAEAVVAAWPRQGVAQVGGIDRATSIAVLTHDPKLDDEALEIALRSDAAYVGAMGSRRMQATRHARLLDRGLDEGELARLAAPIGLDLGALTAEETALSIIAEVVATSRGRSGGRLRSAAGRIHAVVDAPRASQPPSASADVPSRCMS